MTANEFRTMALDLPQAFENRHMNHPDFGVAGRIFATLGYPRRGWGMVKLARATRVLCSCAARGIRASEGGVGARGRHECPIAGRKEGCRARSPDDRLAQAS